MTFRYQLTRITRNSLISKGFHKAIVGSVGTYDACGHKHGCQQNPADEYGPLHVGFQPFSSPCRVRVHHSANAKERDRSRTSRRTRAFGQIAQLQAPGAGPHVTHCLVRAGLRIISLPQFAIDTLVTRRDLPYLGQQTVIFPSSAGTLRDPDNFGKTWRTVRDKLVVPDVTTHSFRKTVATLIDDEGLSARIGADHLGHSNVSMTQDRYMARGRVHAEVAAMLDRTVAINDE